jgi:hypothetical protein
LAAAGKEPPAPAPKKKLSAVALLPSGSQLQGVMLPRYDEDRRLTGVLKAETMTLVSEDVVAGETVSIEFFNPDRSPRGRMDLVKAVLDQGKGLLRAREKVTIQADRIHARGNGLVYSFEQGEGFLAGPVVTRIQAATETTMNNRKQPLHTAAILGVSLAAQPLTGAQDTLPPQEGVVPTAAAGTFEEAAAAARKDLRTDLETSEATTRAAKEFLETADIISQSGTDSSTAATPPAAPLDVKPGPTDTIITCDGGMYFDSDKGLFVYLKNVRVADPRFTLTGANKLEIHLAKKPEPPAPKAGDTPKPGKKDTGLGLGAKFGDVQSIIATGAVRITQKETEDGKEPVQASGAIFTYHPDTGDITLTGGYPWVMQGTTFMRSTEPNNILHINKSGSFKTEGGSWEMGGNLEKAGK